ncbi:hypothetical protein EDD11_004446 [Mortierella claussenii]|nr:hypothetical protein EDD11_004446 [Mortierella claussenii]
MKFSLKAVALSALFASAAVAAPIKRDAASDRIGACFVGLIFTGSWPGSCQAAVAVNIGLIRSIAINQMSMDFTTSNPWVPTTSSNSIVATMLSIPGITLPIDSIRQHIILVDNGAQIGNIDTPWAAASVKGAQLTTSFPSSALNVFSTSHTAFSNFISALSTSASHPITLQGAVDAKLNLGIFGHLTIPGIGFKATVPFDGLNNLNQMKYIYLVDTDFVTNPGFIRLTTIINIVNPTKLSLKLGNVAFSTATADGYVGISTINNLSLNPGNNYVLSATNLDSSLPPTNKFLGDLSSADGVLNLSGYASTSTNPALNAGLAAVKSKLVVPQNFQGSVMSQAPYKNWSLKTLANTNTDHVVQVTATFASPYYGYPLQFTAAQDPSQDNYVQISGVSSAVDGIRLFNFNNDLKFSVSGTGSVTATFTATLAAGFEPSSKDTWVELVNFGKAHGFIPVQFNWFAGIILNNDGITRFVDWGNSATGLGNVNIAVGADFDSILGSFP